MPLSPEVTRKIIQIETEYEAIKEKLPWWHIMLTMTAVGLAVAVYISACGLLTAGTAGVAGAPCVVAGIALILALATMVIDFALTDMEATELEHKADTLERMVQNEIEQQNKEENH